jgi:hypothetical protein
MNITMDDNNQILDKDKPVFINKYYPNGITKNMLVNYYTKNARKILNECDKRRVVLFFSFEPKTKLVIKRNINGAPIIFNENIYFKLINSGNLISIAAEIPEKTNFWVMDIDCKTINTPIVKSKAVLDIIELIKPFVRQYKVFNSTTGFHIYGYLNKKVDRSTQCGLLEKMMEDKLGHKYRIDGQVLDKDIEHDNINIDFSPMNMRGCILVPHALSREGIVCADVTHMLSKTYKSKMITI